MKTKTTKYWVHCAIMFTLTFGIGALPPLGGDITEVGMKVIGAFIGVLYGWCFLDFFWTSCFGLFAIGISGYTTITGALSEGFSSVVALQILFLFIFVEYLIDSGFVECITGWCMTRKFTKGRPFLLIFVILYGCGVTAMLGLGIAGVFVVWAILYEIFNLLGYKKGDLLVTYVLFGAAITSALANAVLPIFTWNILFKSWLAPLGVALPDSGWLIYELAFFTLYMAIFILVGKYVLRLPVQPFIDKAEEVANIYNGKKMTDKQKIAGWMIIIFLAITLLPSFLPDDFTLKGTLSQLGLFGGLFVVVVLTSVIRIKGEPITDWPKNSRRGVDWSMVLMFVATTPIGNALESDKSGIISTVFTLVEPIVKGMTPLVYIVIVLAFFLILTQFAHNVVIAIAFAPTFLTIGASIGVNIAFLSAMICVIAQTAFLTPGSSATGAIVHGNTRWVEVKQAYFVGIVGILIGVICIIALYPTGALLF